MKFTKGSTTVAPEKLWFLQRAHARHLSATGGGSFGDLVDRLYRIVAESLEKLEPSGRYDLDIFPLLRYRYYFSGGVAWAANAKAMDTGKNF
jgi:hypothetical protein